MPHFTDLYAIFEKKNTVLQSNCSCNRLRAEILFFFAELSLCLHIDHLIIVKTTFPVVVELLRHLSKGLNVCRDVKNKMNRLKPKRGMARLCSKQN